MAMKESNLQSSFTKYMKQHANEHFKSSVCYELKITKTGSLPFSRIEPHQITALMDSKFDVLCHKISDMSLGFKPFDGFIAINASAYIGICFYKPRASKIVYMIDIVDMKNEIEESRMSKQARKSLTEKRAKELATLVIDL